jgi:PAS domain S-box-containing protein
MWNHRILTFAQIETVKVMEDVWLRKKVRYPRKSGKSWGKSIVREGEKTLTRLLLVEPDSADAERILALLLNDGAAPYEVRHVVTVEEADACLADSAFDAVLFAWNKEPSFDSAVLNRLIESANISPIIVLITSTDARVGETAIQAGAQDFLVKSRIDGDLLRRAIRYSIDRMGFQCDVDGLTREIAHGKQIIEALSHSQNRMMAITESLYEGVIVFDDSGHIALSNRASHSLLGDRGRLPSHYLDEIFRLKENGQVIDFMNGPLRRVILEQKGVQDDDAIVIRHDGKPLALAYACSPLLEKGEVPGAILSFRDISGVKQAQREALQASKLASVGQLAAGIAHEINTPIQYIGDNLSFMSSAFEALSHLLHEAERLVTERDDPEELSALAKARDAADAEYILDNIPLAARQSLEGVEQVARIVLAMKEFSHPGDRTKTEQDLNRAVENTLTVSRNEWKRWATVETRLEEDLPRVHCLAGEINQVLLNLVVNAAQAIEEAKRGSEGMIRVTTRRKGRMVEIVVEDNGIGMSDEVRSRIFDPFFTTKQVGKGTGQGLAICRDVVVAKHHGRITVESTPGVGSRFSVILPIGLDGDDA